jgi:3' terminal RNA ribose 2'-O-methyltransferase Hen1
MLLTLSTTHHPATDLGYLLHKHPDKVQAFELNFGQAQVFYPEVSERRTTACLLLQVDPIGLVRGKDGQDGFLLQQYVNDRPYVASSFLSVAISKVFGSALNGISKDRPDLVNQPIALTAHMPVVPSSGGEALIRNLFEPLGYTVTLRQLPLDPHFPQWGESRYFEMHLAGTVRLLELLSHLYVLIPVLDNQKHYYIADDEVEKLLAKGKDWLASHPLREQITTRYLRYRKSLVRTALDKLRESDGEAATPEGLEVVETTEDALEKPLSLHQQRLVQVRDVLKSLGAKSVVDLGCGEGKLLRLLAEDWHFQRILGMDVSLRSLEVAAERLRLDRLPERQRERIQLIHGSLTYRDSRLAGFDAAALVEVIEHLDAPRLTSLVRTVFGAARPTAVVITTPNREYNSMWPSLPVGKFRHPDHRFEWTRAEFQAWAELVAANHGYAVRFASVGPEDPVVGAPTQMGIFTLASPTA